MEERANMKKEFHEELDTLKILWPGGGEISFGDDQNLREMLRCLYPDWKTKNKVTSVPTARVPAMFLSPEMMSEKLKNHYKRIQKGDEGELKVYRKFLDGFGSGHDGIIILPNLDNNQLFKSKIGCVEIDMIILHPTKGVFVVSVKNKDLSGQDEIKEKEKLQTDMIKHTDFVWHLSSYQDIDQPCSSSSVMPFIPIHVVFFHLRSDSVNLQDLEINKEWYSSNKFEHVIIFQQQQFEAFQENWCQRLSKIPDFELGENFEILVSRLVALSSMEGAIALIHNKIVSSELQSIQIKSKNADEWHQKQLDDLRCNLPDTTKENLKKCLQSSNVPTKKGKTKVILWTKEQLEIIAEVFDALTTKKKRKPLRLLVEGPKGSGKTMLMIYLAKLAKSVYGNKSTVLVCDGAYGESRILFSQIRQKLEPLEIEVVEGNYYEKIGEIKKGLLLFDEDEMIADIKAEGLLKSLSDEVLLCSFTSSVPPLNINSINRDYRCLTHILRSTSKLSQFSNNFLSAFVGMKDVKGKVAHNLAGEGPDFVTVPATQIHTECVKTVVKYLNLSSKLDSILVMTAFLTLTSQIAIIDKLTQEGYKVYGEHRKNQPNSTSESTQIWFLKNNFNGLEFGTVILPFEGNNGRPLADEILISTLTRATTRLVIVCDTPSGDCSSNLPTLEQIYNHQKNQ